MKDNNAKCNNLTMRHVSSISQMKSLLFEWSEKREFSFSTKPSDWEKQAKRLMDMEEGYSLVPYYYACALSFIMENAGRLVLSSCKNKWGWAQGLVALVPEVDWDAAIFYQVLSAFRNETADDIDIQLAYGVRLFCKKNFNKGLALMKLMPERALNCLSGLMMNDFHRTCDEFEPNKDKEQFAQAFIRTDNLDNDTVCRAYDMAVSFETFTGSTALAFFLKTLPGLDDERRKGCEERIKGLLVTKSSSLVVVLCNWLIRQDHLSHFMEDCVMLVLANLEHPSEDIKRLDNALFLCLINANLFEKIAVLVSEQYCPNEILSFENCLSKLHNKNDSFVNLVLSFVLHPKGDYRFVGRQLWDEYHLENSGFDPLSLNEGEQMLFVVFMLQDLGNPEIRLPKILPLFLSTSEKVRQALLTQMIPYVNNYMGHVMQVMDKLGLDTEETRQLKQYVDARAEVVQKRRKIKELSPVFSQYRYFQEARREEKEFHSQQIKEIEENHTPLWMNMMTTEVLARGGGWRLENGKTNHLAKIEVSVPSRLMVQSMTPLVLDKWINEVFKDWDVTEGDR